MLHNQREITINNESFPVDVELIELVEILNKKGYKTSGCCIGDYDSKDNAWVIIQENDEDNIVRLMQYLDCGYLLTKRMNYRKSENCLYCDYILETTKSEYNKRLQKIKYLVQDIKNIDSLKEYTIKTMEERF